MRSAEDIWRLYEKGVRLHQKQGLVGNTEKAYRFYEGDQWYGLNSDEPMPSYNFIAPTVRYKVASVGMNQMRIYFSALQSGAETNALIRHLNLRASVWWEQLKMDSLCWQVLKESAIAGDSYLYFYDAEGHCQVLDNTDIFLGDETQRDLQRQPYIIIYERRSAQEVRETARKNGIPPETLDKIVSDSRAEHETLMAQYDAEDDGKCGCLLYMTCRNGNLYFSRSTRRVIYQPEQCIRGMERYPIASLITSPRKGSARGRGEVLPLIPNQIEVNRNLARRIINAKLTAFSRLVYASDKIENPEALGQVGTAIAVNDSTISDIHSAVGYMTPSAMSPDAKVISDEMITITRQLADAGVAATGDIDPTLASGSAIVAARDQAQIPLNEQLNAFRQFVEDVALIWYQLWICYHPEGLEVNGQIIPTDKLRALRPLVRVDATSTTPFSKYTREETLGTLFEKNAISFEEYVNALDDDSTIPKSKLLEILKERGQEHE